MKGDVVTGLHEELGKTPAGRTFSAVDREQFLEAMTNFMVSLFMLILLIWPARRMHSS